MGNCDTCKSHWINCTGGEWAREACEKNGMYEPVTNADRIRAMSDEELCDEYFRIYHNVLPRYTHSRLGLLEWLKQECE